MLERLSGFSLKIKLHPGLNLSYFRFSNLRYSELDLGKTLNEVQSKIMKYRVSKILLCIVKAMLC